MAFWGPIIGAGISAIGALFGSKKKPEKTTTEVDYVRMAENAERAGFSPLTVLRNGGSAGFVTTTHPALSSWGTAFGEAAQILGNALMSFDPQADRRAELENLMLEKQLETFDRTNRVGRDGFATMMFGDVPTRMGSQVVDAAGRPMRMPPVASWFDPPNVVAGTAAVSGGSNRPGTGGAIPIWVPGIDRDGKEIWIANPEGPDLEQLIGAYATRSISGWEALAGAGWKAATGPDPIVRVKKSDKPASWWPEFGIEWR